MGHILNGLDEITNKNQSLESNELVTGYLTSGQLNLYFTYSMIQGSTDRQGFPGWGSQLST